jgi:hypothetical protein
MVCLSRVNPPYSAFSDNICRLNWHTTLKLWTYITVVRANGNFIPLISTVGFCYFLMLVLSIVKYFLFHHKNLPIITFSNYKTHMTTSYRRIHALSRTSFLLHHNQFSCLLWNNFLFMGIFQESFILVASTSDILSKSRRSRQCKNIDQDIKSTWDILYVRRSVRSST